MLLMDAVLSSSLLALVAFFVLTLLPSSSILLHQGRYRGHALQFAQALLENLDFPAPGQLAAPPHQYEGIAFTAGIEITPVAGESPEQLLQAHCAVHWRDALGDHQLELASYLAPKP
ncbi:hypothetical protein ABS71_17190 [bacterium SCN 62-11]|nr:MAG: hypothetical protein ABS71_17190 [bacterium SCN 62-11]